MTSYKGIHAIRIKWFNGEIIRTLQPPLSRQDIRFDTQKEEERIYDQHQNSFLLKSGCYGNRTIAEGFIIFPTEDELILAKGMSGRLVDVARIDHLADEKKYWFWSVYDDSKGYEPVLYISLTALKLDTKEMGGVENTISDTVDRSDWRAVFGSDLPILANIELPDATEMEMEYEPILETEDKIAEDGTLHRFFMFDEAGKCRIRKLYRIRTSALTKEHCLALEQLDGKADVIFQPHRDYELQFESTVSCFVFSQIDINCAEIEIEAGEEGATEADLRPNIESFNINNNAEESFAQSVELTSVCTNEPTHYMVSHDFNFTTADWIVYNNIVWYYLLTTGSNIIYFKVKNEFGESGVVSASIKWGGNEAISLTENVSIEFNVSESITFQDANEALSISDNVTPINTTVVENINIELIEV